MRRIKMVLAVAAMMAMLLALMAGPALAQTDTLPPFGIQGTPGKAHEQHAPPLTTLPTAGPTGAPQQAANCYGQSQFTGFAGPSSVTPFPGSAAEPVQFGGQLNFSGPAHVQFLQTDTTPGAGNPISNFQQDVRGLLAGTSPTNGTCPALPS